MSKITTFVVAPTSTWGTIGTIWHVLTESAAAQLIHSFVASRFDYCNSLLYGLPDTQLDSLQRIQNIACRRVCQVPKAVHITPYLENQHWLPIKQRIMFKVLLLAYRAYSGMAPGYLCDLVCPKESTRWSLRSGDKLELQNPVTRLKTYGDRCFEFCCSQGMECLAPSNQTVWNTGIIQVWTQNFLVFKMLWYKVVKLCAIM